MKIWDKVDGNFHELIQSFLLNKVDENFLQFFSWNFATMSDMKNKNQSRHLQFSKCQLKTLRNRQISGRWFFFHEQLLSPWFNRSKIAIISQKISKSEIKSIWEEERKKCLLILRQFCILLKLNDPPTN